MAKAFDWYGNVFFAPGQMFQMFWPSCDPAQLFPPHSRSRSNSSCFPLTVEVDLIVPFINMKKTNYIQNQSADIQESFLPLLSSISCGCLIVANISASLYPSTVLGTVLGIKKPRNVTSPVVPTATETDHHAAPPLALARLHVKKLILWKEGMNGKIFVWR